jgi:hypothetical protein
MGGGVALHIKSAPPHKLNFLSRDAALMGDPDCSSSLRMTDWYSVYPLLLFFLLHYYFVPPLTKGYAKNNEATGIGQIFFEP